MSGMLLLPTVGAAFAAFAVALIYLTRRRSFDGALGIAAVLIMAAMGTILEDAPSIPSWWTHAASTTRLLLAATLLGVAYRLKRITGLLPPGGEFAPGPLVAWGGAVVAIIMTWVIPYGSPSAGGTSSEQTWLIDGHGLTTMYLAATLIVVLAQFEQVLRQTPDPVRYQIKFVVIGLGALAGYELFEAGKVFASGQLRPSAPIVGSCVVAISAGLIWYGGNRLASFSSRPTLYVSSHVLHASLTAVIVLTYLGLGLLLRHSVSAVGWSVSDSLGSVVFFATSVGLIIFLVSRTVQVRMRQLIARFMYRARYDYRAKWLEVTDAFRQASTVEGILDQLLQLLSHTFGAPRISIWMQYEADDRFHQVRSVTAEPPPPPLSMSHPMMIRLSQSDEAIEVDPQTTKAPLDRDPFLTSSKAVLCVPIRCGGALQAFVTLSQERPGEDYGQDDRDLLRAIAHHAGVLLSQARLAEELGNSAEFEALHRVAAFCLHDLKNLTAQLSLVVQNAEAHGHDPRFQKSALRTVTGTVQKMMTLMAKLSLTTPRSGQTEDVNVHAAIAETIRSIAPGQRSRVRQLGESVPSVRMARDQLHQVLLNVILNAQQAVGEQGEIRVLTARKEGAVVITVSDSGPGIGEERLRTLFRPFRSTKQGGFGLGLYECKRIVAGYQGTIRIDSEVGKGTRVTMTLPCALSSRNGQTSTEAAAV